jgi:glyceraldehyde-3-phosphate dehydrogenase (NADP+)
VPDPQTLEIRSPYDGRVVAEVKAASPAEIEAAARGVAAAHAGWRGTPAHARGAILRKAAERVLERREAIARTLALESGKIVRDARAEVDRCGFVLRASAEEAVRIGGEAIPYDGAPHGEGRYAILRRFPAGPVLAITPFNFPINLPAHKVGPALAAGCGVLLKPSERTPLSALALGSAFAEAGLPEDGPLRVSVCARERAGALVGDPRFGVVSFTGSPDVGWRLKAAAGRARVVLELGGNAGVIVHSDADVALAAERCTAGGFAVAGQSCISVQRILLHERIAEPFLAEFLPRVAALRTGDPLDESTDVGPLIDDMAAERVVAWIREALAAGARALCGGAERSRSIVRPTVLADVRRDLPIYCREVFGPVVVVETYSDFEDALARADDSEFGLQAGVFTSDVERIHRAFERLEVGAVLVNEVPTYRHDAAPYGGVKGSGLGREGIRSSIEHLTEPRLLVVTRPHRRG